MDLIPKSRLNIYVNKIANVNNNFSLFLKWFLIEKQHLSKCAKLFEKLIADSKQTSSPYMRLGFWVDHTMLDNISMYRPCIN